MQKLEEKITELKNDILFTLHYYVNFSKLETIYSTHEITKQKNYALDRIIENYNEGFNLGVHGQYSFSIINNEQKGAWNELLKKYDELPEKYSHEIKNILKKKYIYPLKNYNCKTIDNVIDHMNQIRCDNCDELSRSNSKYCCNCGTKF